MAALSVVVLGASAATALWYAVRAFRRATNGMTPVTSHRASRRG